MTGRIPRDSEMPAPPAGGDPAGTGTDAAGSHEPDTRCGFIALIGAPNVGKSTLVNALVGAKVSIVTHKLQTTRALLRGIAMEGAAQLVFIRSLRTSDRSTQSACSDGAHARLRDDA